jgi:hypothetical protein
MYFVKRESDVVWRIEISSLKVVFGVKERLVFRVLNMVAM